MKTLRHLMAAALACAAAFSAVAHAGEAEIRKNLGARFPQFAQIDEVRKTPVGGLYEVRVGNDLFYVDEQGDYLVQGEMIDVKGRRNLTQERVNKLNEVAAAAALRPAHERARGPRGAVGVQDEQAEAAPPQPALDAGEVARGRVQHQRPGSAVARQPVAGEVASAAVAEVDADPGRVAVDVDESRCARLRGAGGGERRHQRHQRRHRNRRCATPRSVSVP